MTQETDWNAVADAAHREWVDSEREDKIEQLEAEIARLRAEADANRVDAERMRKVVRKIRARADSEGTWVQHGGQYVAGLRNAANMIEKAMGADA